MGKFRLDIETVEVETFVAGSGEGRRGTVRGHDTLGLPDNSGYPDTGCDYYDGSVRCPTSEVDSCEACTSVGSGRCQRTSLQPTYCPYSQCTGA